MCLHTRGQGTSISGYGCETVSKWNGGLAAKISRVRHASNGVHRAAGGQGRQPVSLQAEIRHAQRPLAAGVLYQLPKPAGLLGGKEKKQRRVFCLHQESRHLITGVSKRGIRNWRLGGISLR